MGFIAQISAMLGIDSSSVPGDMAKAGAQMKQGAQAAGEGAASEFGDKFNHQLEHKFLGREAFHGLFLGLGLDPAKIADTIAGAIVGGTKEGWQEALKVSEENSKLLDELLNHGKSRGQRESDLKHQIALAEAEAKSVKGETYKDPTQSKADEELHGTKYITTLNAEQLKQQQEAQNRALKARVELNKLADEDKKDQERLIKEQHDHDLEKLSIAERVVALQKDQNALLAKSAEGLNKGTLSKGEQAEIQIQLLDYQKKIDELQKVTVVGVNDELKEREKVTDELNKQTKAHDKLNDRSKLSLGELASVKSSGFGVDERVADQARQAREAIRLEQQGNKLRLSGDSAGAEAAFSQADKIKSGLTALNSADRGPGAALSKAFEPANQSLKDIKAILSGKFVNE